MIIQKIQYDFEDFKDFMRKFIALSQGNVHSMNLTIVEFHDYHLFFIRKNQKYH